jgi:hypothetical protein
MKYSTILSAITLLLAFDTTTVAALNSSYYADNSRLASGRWVKIKVTENGIQQLDDATLKALGFANPEKVAVYGYGGFLLLDDYLSTKHPDDLPRQYAVHTAGKLLFYGQTGESLSLSGLSVTVNTSPYSFEGCYFLTDTPVDELSTESIEYVAADNTNDTHVAAYAINRDKQSYNHIGERWFDKLLESSSATSYKFPITDAVSNTNMRLCFAWASEVTASLSLAVSPDVTPISTTGDAISSPTSMSRRTGYQTFLPPEDADTLSVDFTLTAARGIAKFIAMDYATLSFYRNNTLGGDSQRTMHLSVGSDTNVKFINLPADAQVWDVTSAADVRPYAISADGAITPSASNATVILFNPTAQQHTPEVVDTNVAAQNLHALATPQMLIITLPEVREQAEELAQLHRDEQGLDVLVVNAPDIYNEFSSGTLSAQGIRRFVKMLYDRNPSRLRSLLIYGAGSQDMRHITHALPIIPVRECSTDAYMFSASQSFCTDSYYAMLSDSYNPSSIWHQAQMIAVGRIPVSTPLEAANINSKIRRFMLNPEWQRVANTSIYISDNVDGGQYNDAIENISANISSRTGSTTFKDYIDLFPSDYSTASPQLNTRLTTQINEGVGFVHYIGHSDYDGLVSGIYGITSQRVRRYTNEALPIFVLSTCNLGQFDGVRSTLGMTLMTSPNAAVACMVYARESWAKGNEDSHTIMSKRLAAAHGGMSLGELWLAFRKECIDLHRSSTRYSINDLNFNLLGDPEMPLRFPTYHATIALTGKTSSEGANDSVSVTALTPLSVTGEVCDSLGNRLTDFNGTVTLQVMQEGIVATTRGLRDNTTKGKEITCGSISLTKVTADVIDGAYKTSLTIPQQCDSCDIRIIAYAESADMSTAATGELSGLTLTTPADASDDTTAPVITTFYAGTEENVVTSATAKLHAEIAPDKSGIALGTMPLENVLHLSIDGQIVGNAVGYAKACADGTAIVEMPVGSITDGRHTATVSICDNCGNRSESTITFEVAMAKVAATLRCLTDVARESALFELEHSYLSTTPEATIIITDRRGATVANAKMNDTEWQWNLTDLNGKPVSNGTYTASVLTTDGRRYTASAPVTFTVLR